MCICMNTYVCWVSFGCPFIWVSRDKRTRPQINVHADNASTHAHVFLNKLNKIALILQF